MQQAVRSGHGVGYHTYNRYIPLLSERATVVESTTMACYIWLPLLLSSAAVVCDPCIALADIQTMAGYIYYPKRLQHISNA